MNRKIFITQCQLPHQLSLPDFESSPLKFLLLENSSAVSLPPTLGDLFRSLIISDSLGNGKILIIHALPIPLQVLAAITLMAFSVNFMTSVPHNFSDCIERDSPRICQARH